MSDKEKIVRTGNRLSIAGLVALATSIVAVVLLVADYIFDLTTAIATSAGIAVVIVATWYGLAFLLREER